MSIVEGLFRALGAAFMVVAACLWLGDVVRPEGMDSTSRRVAALCAFVVCLATAAILAVTALTGGRL